MKFIAAFAIIACASAGCTEKTEDKCNADTACTWCKCAALPSQCWTLADAKKLPAGVYQCDKSVEVEEVEVPSFKCCTTCNATAGEEKYFSVAKNPMAAGNNAASPASSHRITTSSIYLSTT